MCFVYWLGANVPRRLGEVGLVQNEKGELSVESIRSYCSLAPSKGNLCLLDVITVKLLFLGPSKLSVLEKQTYVTSVHSQYIKLYGNGTLYLASSRMRTSSSTDTVIMKESPCIEMDVITIRSVC